MLARVLKRLESTAETLVLLKDLGPPGVLQEALTASQLERVHTVASVIDELSVQESQYLWDLFQERYEACHGPPDFTEGYPPFSPAESWPELTAEHVELFYNLRIQRALLGALPGSLTEAEAGPEPTAEVEEVQEKTNFDVCITSFPASAKIKLIKEVKTVMNIGLKEAKETVEGIEKQPLVLAKAAPKDRAEELMAKIKELGCEVELK